MASTYPGALDVFVTTRADGTPMATTHAQDHDNENDAINKIEAELGVNPRGGSATVRARLDVIQPPSPSAYTLTNAPAALRTLNFNAYTMDNVAAALMTLISDLKARGIVG
jgi:hypothetical protein